MHQTLIRRYEDNCLMLMDEQDGELQFLGTAFIVHRDGYLLTAAHLLESAQNPVVVKPSTPGGFSPLVMDAGHVTPVKTVRLEADRDVALLRMEQDLAIGAPDDFIGNPEQVAEGTYLLAFGIPFGHFRIHNAMVVQSMLSAKMLTPNETRILVFDVRMHPGDIGGPVVNAETGRILGIIQGSFDPIAIQGLDQPEDFHLESRFSYAVSIEYASEILEQEGLLKSFLN